MFAVPFHLSNKRKKLLGSYWRAGRGLQLKPLYESQSLNQDVQSQLESENVFIQAYI